MKISKVCRLVLFDIDGTILHGGRLFRECFEGAMKARFNRTTLPRVSFSGKTDRQICRELIRAGSLMSEEPSDLFDNAVDEIIQDYLARVRDRLPHRSNEIRLLPGVEAVLSELQSRTEVKLGLLTGNVREGARLKLSAVGMHPYFDFGVYGDDHWDRYQLPGIAVRRAKEQHGIEFRGKQVVIIGDTIHDVNCGRSLGVRAIGVGTGQSDQREQILGASPDYFFNDLSDTSSVVEAILKDMADPLFFTK